MRLTIAFRSLIVNLRDHQSSHWSAGLVCSDFFEYMGMKYPVMLRHLYPLLGGASFDWQLALEWLVPMTNSQIEGVVGSGLVSLVCLVDEVPVVKGNPQLTKMRLRRHDDGDKDSWAVTRNQIGGFVGNLNQQWRSPSLSYCCLEPNIYKIEGSIRNKLLRKGQNGQRCQCDWQFTNEIDAAHMF